MSCGDPPPFCEKCQSHHYGSCRGSVSYYYAAVCPYCGGSCLSPEQCPRVKAIKYYPDGRVKRVKLRKKEAANWGTITVWPPVTPSIEANPWVSPTGVTYALGVSS